MNFAAAEVCQDLWTQLVSARDLTDALFRIVRTDSLYERPIAERHRIIFYLGHLEAFDWNLFLGRLVHEKSFHPEFDQLFAFGIDPVGGGLPSDQPRDWPSVEHVKQYVSRIRKILDDQVALSTQSEPSSDKRDYSAETLLHVAIEHRLMHAETLAYMLHQLPLERKLGREAPTAMDAAPVVPRMITIPSGTATLGLGHDNADAFGWDNEFKAHTVAVPEFAIDQYMTTNSQFLEFIAAGGYEDRSLWTEDGWQWKCAANISHPIFWKRNGGRWLYRTMFAEVPLPLEWPVFVSHAEASAYARWAGKSLPTEAQWHRAAFGAADGKERAFPWGSDPPNERRGNFDFYRWNPEGVGAHPASASGFGVTDLMGNGWEWTSTEFGPFPGFKAFSFYPGYSANFFDGKHYVLKGGSMRTAACMLRKSFRNWFQPHYQYAYTGFRCVSS